MNENNALAVAKSAISSPSAKETRRREQSRARQKAYRERNPARVRESAARYRNANRDKLFAAGRLRYLANHDANLAYARKHNASRAAYNRQWQRDHADEINERNRLRRSVQADLPGVLAAAARFVHAFGAEPTPPPAPIWQGDHIRSELRDFLAGGHQPIAYQSMQPPEPPPIIPSDAFDDVDRGKLIAAYAAKKRQAAAAG